MATLDDLKPMNPNTVTENVQQPPSGVSVTEVSAKAVGANTLNQAEAKQQAQTKAENLATTERANDYIFTIEHGPHKVTITPEHGGVYNFHALCSCAWEGRFITSNEAEVFAKRHITLSPRRG